MLLRKETSFIFGVDFRAREVRDIFEAALMGSPHCRRAQCFEFR